MPKPKLPGFPGLCVLLGIALVLASFPPGGARADSETETETETETEATVEATVDRCRSAIESSSARFTCSMRRLGVSVVNEQCRFKTICAMNQAFSNRITSITVSLEDASRLSNCNGYLTVGSC